MNEFMILFVWIWDFNQSESSLYRKLRFVKKTYVTILATRENFRINLTWANDLILTFTILHNTESSGSAKMKLSETLYRSSYTFYTLGMLYRTINFINTQFTAYTNLYTDAVKKL
jgi:hypothetical protein